MCVLKHFPGSSKNISTVFFLGADIRELRAKFYYEYCTRKYLWGIASGLGKKVVYITRLVCARSLFSSQIINIIISNIRARATSNDISYELNPRGIEDEITFCAPQPEAH